MMLAGIADGEWRGAKSVDVGSRIRKQRPN